MSDHRASITVKFKIYGREYDWDTYVNYFPEEVPGVDGSVIDFFAHAYEDARANWDHQNMVEDERRTAEALEKTERAELARLKAKYEPLANILVPDQEFNWRPRVVRGDSIQPRNSGRYGPTPEPPDADASLGPAWTETYEGQGFGRMGVDGSSVRWRNPSPAGVYGGGNVTCKECGCIVTIKVGETIDSDDPRLCEHLGGPRPISGDRGWGFGMKAGESSPADITGFTVDEQGPTQQ